MRDRTKQLLVINTGEKKQSDSGSQTIINQYSSYGSGGSGVDLRDYLLKRIWDTAWELRTTEEGESYIFCKLPFVSQHGVTLYADGGNIDLPSLYAGIPVDGTTITKREDGTLMLNPNLELGGLDEEALQKYLDDYNYAKLSDIPSLDGYAKLTDVDSRINDLVNGAPAAYDTLKEIADVLQGNVNSIGDIITTLGTKADKTYVDTELAKYIPIAGDTEVTGIKNFLNGLKVGGLPISKYEGYDDVIYIDANVVLRGGLTQYAVDPVTIPSIIDSLPIAGYESKGVASFSSEYFVIDANGKVSIIPDSVGLNEEELEAWLANSDYTTKTYADDTFATKSSLNATNTEVAKKWTQDDDKIANWDTAYGWGNHASAGYALSTEVAVELAKYLPLKGGTLTGHLSLKPTAYIKIQGGYSILGLSDNIYFVGATNHPTNIKSDGTLTHNGAIIWDSSTLTSLSQLNNDADFTTNAYVNETFVTLKGDPQTIESEKDFTGGLKVNGSPITYDSENGYWLLQGNLLITGGLTQYVDDGSVDLPNLYDGLPIDNQTIYWEETANGKVLKAKVAEGGITSITDAMIIEALGYTPYNASNPNGYITTAALNGYATQTWVNQQGFLTEHQDLSGYATEEWVEGKGYLTSHQSLNGYVNAITTTGSGNAVTSVSKSGKALVFIKNATYLTTTVANGLYHPLTTFASVATSGSYNDLSNKPTIPSNTNQLTNGAGFITIGSTVKAGAAETTNTLVNWCKANQSYVGSIALSGTWYNLISVRHRNGASDGNLYGMSLYSSLTGDDNLIWRQHINNAWGTAKVLLDSSNYSSYALPLSGGTLTGTLRLTTLTEPNGNGLLCYHPTDWTGVTSSQWGVGTIDSQGVIRSSDANLLHYKGGTLYTIWDSGNSNLSSVDWNASKLILNTTNTTDWNVARANNTIQLLRNSGTVGNAPNTYSSGISIMTSYTGFQLASYGGDWNNLYFRSIRDNDTWLPWRTVAFLDSNVSSATKLQTARTIWGQSFDGTGDVSGALSNVTGITFKNDYYGLAIDEFGNFSFKKPYSITAADWSFKDSSGNKLMIINNSGNVGIGTTSPNSKLTVAGQLNITTGTAAGMTQGQGLLCIGSLTGGHIMIDQNDIQAKSNGTTAAPIYINDWGGNIILGGSGYSYVGIGTTSPNTKLTVKHTGDTVGIRLDGGWSGYGYRYTAYALAIDGVDKATFGYNTVTSSHNTTAQCGTYIFNLTSNEWMNFNNEGGVYLHANFLVKGGITQYSDIRKKTKLQDVELSLKQVANAPLIEHYYNNDDKKTTHVGSIAQYWADMNDWFCKLDSDGYYTMEIQNAALASAISVARELERYESKTDKKIRLLKKRINELEDEIEKLKSA